ncbi:MAG TPA: hypothetical protein VGD36_12015 [Xanthobacteraceae bacterium]|jgi:uncharacterized membrane protein
MALITPAHHYARSDEATRLGPQLVFLLALGLAAAAAMTAANVLPNGFVLPVVCTLLFAAAGIIALLAWRSRAAASQPSYWDVAGALTLIGVCASALLEPEQVVALVDLAPRRN